MAGGSACMESPLEPGCEKDGHGYQEKVLQVKEHTVIEISAIRQDGKQEE